ncbi:MAG: hypothetical protein INQ03_18085 [Candidatus Heimdallarchaeota archaeon]|nr:hypothetical protein [Candidatus Heimdallarchaeota archaeon]
MIIEKASNRAVSITFLLKLISTIVIGVLY